MSDNETRNHGHLVSSRYGSSSAGLMDATILLASPQFDGGENISKYCFVTLKIAVLACGHDRN